MNPGVGGHALLQGIFPTQGSNLCLLRLLRWQRALHHSNPLEDPGAGAPLLKRRGAQTTALATPQSRVCVRADVVKWTVEYDGFSPVVNACQWTAECIKDAVFVFKEFVTLATTWPS